MLGSFGSFVMLAEFTPLVANPGSTYAWIKIDVSWDRDRRNPVAIVAGLNSPQ